jgi:hypothetical protein
MAIEDDAYAGMHELSDEYGPLGSIEIFWAHAEGACADNPEWFPEPGWYWWACQPGCLPDGEPMGPFRTSDEAWKDASDED